MDQRASLRQRGHGHRRGRGGRRPRGERPEPVRDRRVREQWGGGREHAAHGLHRRRGLRLRGGVGADQRPAERAGRRRGAGPRRRGGGGPDQLRGRADRDERTGRGHGLAGHQGRGGRRHAHEPLPPAHRLRVERVRFPLGRADERGFARRAERAAPADLPVRRGHERRAAAVLDRRSRGPREQHARVPRLGHELRQRRHHAQRQQRAGGGDAVRDQRARVVRCGRRRRRSAFTR